MYFVKIIAIAFFLTALGNAQTMATFVASPNTEYRYAGFSQEFSTARKAAVVWDAIFLHTEAGYQGLSGARFGIKLCCQTGEFKLSVSPGIYGSFGQNKSLFGPGAGLGWKLEYKRLEFEGLAIQYINPSSNTLRRYTIGEGEVALKVVKTLFATCGGEAIDNQRPLEEEREKEKPRLVRWGGGLEYRIPKGFRFFAHNRGSEAQIGIRWVKPKAEE